MRENACQFSKVSPDHLTCLPPMLSRDSWILWTDSVPVVTAMSPLRVLQKCWVSRKFLLVPKARYLSCSCLQTTVLSSCNSSMCWDLTCPVFQLNTFPPTSSSVEHWDQAFRQTLEITLLRNLRWRQFCLESGLVQVSVPDMNISHWALHTVLSYTTPVE